MSGSVSLLARSALEVKAKGLATPVGVPSGQRRSPYHGGVVIGSSCVHLGLQEDGSPGWQGSN